MRLLALLLCLLSIGCADARATVIRLRDVDAGQSGASDADLNRDGGATTRDGSGAQADAQVDLSKRGLCRITAGSGFRDTFDSGNLDGARFLVADANLAFRDPIARGGFARDNVRPFAQSIVLSVRGERYAGPVRGVAPDGSRRADGKRSGAAIATRDLFQSATYQAELTLQNAPEGVELSLFLVRDDAAEGYVGLRFPGRVAGLPSANALLGLSAGPGQSLEATELSLLQRFDDGLGHALRLDLRAGTQPDDLSSLTFWADATERDTLMGRAPERAGRLWLTLTVRDDAAADFDTFEVVLDTLFVTPFEESKDACADGELSLDGLVEP